MTSPVVMIRSMEVAAVLQVNVLEAKTDFSRLIRLLESGREDAITVARNGKPVVRMTLIDQGPTSRRIGVARGKFAVKGDFDEDNAEIAALFTEETP